MGLDVQIFIKVSDGESPPENESRVEGVFVPCEGWVAEDAPFATHELSSMTRYYGKHYARGPWPDISALLLFLLMHPSVEKVWYGSDNHEPVEGDEFTLSRLEELNSFYVSQGHLGYGGKKVR